MKQFTNNEQTAKLIELGFEPSTRIPFEVGNDELGRTFSIGELIEMLPKEYDSEALSIGWHYMADVWIVRHPTTILIYKEELVDALYEMVIILKEEGVI